MDVDRLRAETRPEHQATEALMPLMDPDLTRSRYLHVLQCMYPVVHGWETWAQGNAPVRFLDMVRSRQRAPLMETDIRSLGGDPDELVTATDQFQALFGHVRHNETRFDAVFLGAMYVMEGSTLGGQYIARHVEQELGFVPGEGDAYFRGYLERTGSMWQSFKALLLELPEASAEDVIASAKAMFRFFGEHLRGASTNGA